jgi:glycosyltransferase involved in cell wall biosynthesis
MNVYGGLLFSLFRSFLKIKCPVHIIVDSSSIPVIASAPMLRIMRFASSSIAKIICYTRLQRDFWNTHIASSIATFIPLGVDTQKYFPTMESSDYIFSCGRTARDFPTLISAARNEDYWLIIVTGKDSLTGKTGIGDAPIPKNVKVYYEIPSSQYEKLLSKSKFVILPLKDVPYECGLSVLLHSMAMGKTVVVTRTALTVDYVVDGDTGIFVQPYDTDDLRDKIRYLLENPKKLKEIGANGRMAVESLFNEQNMARNFAEVLTSVRYRRS